MKPGVGMLAVRNQTPVLPAYVWGSYQSWPRGKKIPSRHRLKCFAGKLIIPSGDKAARKSEQARINQEVEDAIRALERDAWQGEEGIPEKLLAAWAGHDGGAA